MKHTPHLIALISLLLITLTACTTSPNNSTSTAMPTLAMLTITPATTPWATITPESHSWQAEPILAELFTSAGFTSEEYARTKLPSLILYADGHLITTHINYSADEPERSISEAQLQPTEVCAFLYQIEANGFFDFNPHDYHPPQVTDMGTTHISIHAWRSRDTSSYALEVFNTSGQNADVPTPLAATHWFLSNFRFANAKPYQPDKIAVLISQINLPDLPQSPMPWALTNPKLSDLVKRADNGNAVLLQGPDAINVYNILSINWMGIFSENGTTYSVAVRPLLPLEQWLSPDGWSSAPSFPVTPTLNLNCDPSMIGPLPTTNQFPTVPAHTVIPFLP